MEIIALVTAALLFLVVWGFVEYATLQISRSDDRRGEGPRYKRHWQIAGLFTANALVVAALWLVSALAAALTAGGLFMAWIVFRFLLERSSTMQRLFLKRPLRSDASTRGDEQV